MPARHFDYREMLRTVHRREVKAIVIGGVCAAAHGAPITTFDLDLVHDRSPENVDRILSALKEFEAYHRERGDRRLPLQSQALEGTGPSLFITKLGSLDFIGQILGTDYRDLLSKSIETRLGDLTLRILDLETLIEAKRVADRPKDHAMMPILLRTLEEQKRQDLGPDD